MTTTTHNKREVSLSSLLIRYDYGSSNLIYQYKTSFIISVKNFSLQTGFGSLLLPNIRQKITMLIPMVEVSLR
jgi:hypothetical protein